MKNISLITDDILLTNIKSLVLRERELTVEILHHLREVELRQLFARLGFSSLYEYAIKELGYSEASAHRRISSMRLLRALPEIEVKIETGKLALSTLSQAQTFFRHEKITDVSTKRDLLNRLEGKSAREVEKVLVMESSAPERLKAEKIKPMSEHFHQLNLTLSQELVEKLEELKALLSHRNPSSNFAGLLTILVEEGLEKHRVKAPKAFHTSGVGGHDNNIAKNKPFGKRAPFAKPVSSVEADLPSHSISSESNRRHIPIAIKRRVWLRDGAKCTYVAPQSGRSCQATHFLEYDHIHPLALGGDSSEKNLRLRCRAHNRLAAIDTFGAHKIRSFVRSIGT